MYVNKLLLHERLHQKFISKSLNFRYYIDYIIEFLIRIKIYGFTLPPSFTLSCLKIWVRAICTEEMTMFVVYTSLGCSIKKTRTVI